MLLADGFFLVVGGLFLFGVVGLVIMSIALLVRCFQFVFRRIAGTATFQGEPVLKRDGRLVCAEPRCGYVNPADARYCARCGRRLEHGDLDAYG